MSDKISFSCNIEPSLPEKPLGFEIWLDGQCMVDIDAVTESQLLSFEFEETSNEHVIEFVLKNKTSLHTVIDQNNNIVEDSLILVQNIALDGIELTNIVQNIISYTHDFNGTGASTTDTFYGTMGCNGRAVFKFNDPVYLWLLENL